MSNRTGNHSIPVIDLRDFPRQSEKLITACEEWGCFRIVNFQNILDESVMAEMKEVVRSLLELPVEIKRRNKDAIAGSGYMEPSEINPMYEALGLYDMASVEAIEAFCSQMESTPRQRETMLKYSKSVKELMMDIVQKIGVGLGINDLASFEDWVYQFRINKYTFTPQSVGSLGVQLHTDSSFLTLLQDDETIGGLQVMKRSGIFEVVDPCPGTLIVNLGDIAKVWSNGRFLNVKHRVMCNEAGIRLSIASFLLGPKEAVLVAPPELIDLGHPAMFLPFTYRDYRTMRMSKKLHVGEALDYLRYEAKSTNEEFKS